MANYNKSFNFRNGVQVDTDKFIVLPSGLVGIGSTLPKNYLDVKGGGVSGDGISVTGDVNVTGLVTTSQVYVTGISTFLGNVGIGTTNIDAAANSNNTTILNAGIVTAVKYYGSGLYLDDIVGFSTEAWIVHKAEDSSVERSGIATDLKVGIGTTQAHNDYDLLIGENPSSTGIGFNGSTGNMNVSGTITASTFSGNLSGNVTGNVFYSSGISSFTTLKVGSGVTITSGIATFATISGTGLTVSGGSTFTGIITSSDTLFATQLSASGVCTFAGITTSSSTLFTTQLNASGVSTFNDNISVADTIFHTGNTNTTIRFPADNNISFETDGNEVLRIDENQRVGIGTSNPTVDFQIRRDISDTDATLQVISKTSTIAIGHSESLQGGTGQFRYGSTSTDFKYSNEQTLEIINYGQGNINYILNPLTKDNIAIDENFYWIKNEDPLMSLTHEGNLGIGITMPKGKLHVVGISSLNGELRSTGKTTLASNGGITTTGGNLFVEGSLNVKGAFNPTNLTVTGFCDLEDIDAGVTTVSSLDSTESIKTDKIGINTNVPSELQFQINSAESAVYVNSAGYIGIKTDKDYVGTGYTIAVAIPEHSVIIGDKVGIGTTLPRAALDVGVGASLVTSRFMILPTVTTTERDNLPTIGGSLIFNSTTKKLNFHNGEGWAAISTES